MKKQLVIVMLLVITLICFGCDRITSSRDSNKNSDANRYDPTYLSTLLFAELAQNQNQPALASQNFLSLALAFQDPVLAKKAAYLAMRIGHYRLTLQSVTLWAQLQPKDLFPQILASLLLLNTKTKTNIQPYLTNIFNIQHQQPRLTILMINNRLTTLASKNRLLVNLQILYQKLKNDPQLFFSQSLVAVDLNYTDLALSAINKALGLQPKWIEAIGLKAQILLAKQQKQQAINYLAAQMQLQPHQSSLRTVYAFVLLQAGNLTAAKQQYQQLLTTKQRGNALIKLGVIAYRQKETETANNYFQQAIKMAKYTNEARYLLGDIASTGNAPQKAQRLYLSVSHGPFYFSARIKAAFIMANNSYATKALLLLNQMNPSTPLQIKLLALAKAQILFNAKRFFEVMTTLETGLGLLPNDVELLYMRGLVAAKLGKFHRMEQDLKEVIRQQPSNALALNALGYALADKTNRYQEALSYISRSLKIKPNNPLIIDSMGWVQYRLGHYKKSLYYLERAQALSDDSEIAMHLGEVLWISGDHHKAKLVWQNALQKNPGNQDIIQTMERFLTKDAKDR